MRALPGFLLSRSRRAGAAPPEARRAKIDRFALIIGAMKAGTPLLFDALASHPEIAGARTREPNFFGSDRWKDGRDWYERQWEGFDPARHAWALEASTQYSKHPWHPEVAERIAAFGARFRFLYMLCDPVARIERHLGHKIARGQTTAEGYRAALDQALAASRYAAQLERFRAALGAPEILLVDGEAFAANPLPELNRCADFLGIEPDHPWPAALPSDDAAPFRLGEDERAELGQRLREDMLRLRDGWGFDVAQWGFSDEAYVPLPARSPSPGPVRGPAPSTGGQKAIRGNYWSRRQDMMYYRYVRALVGPLAAEARSLIDVGSHGTSLSEEFDWIPDRVALDLKTPYSSDKVKGIQADFLQFRPDRRFDFALCLQVLEHVPQAEAFARKLLDVADHVLVSVPYKWPKNSHRDHCQDPVDEQKLAQWFGRTPDYSIVVEEPLLQRKHRRLIAYFHKAGEPFDRARFRSMERRLSPAASAGRSA